MVLEKVRECRLTETADLLFSRENDMLTLYGQSLG